MSRELVNVIFEVLEDLRLDLVSTLNHARTARSFSPSSLINGLMWQSWNLFLEFRKLSVPAQVSIACLLLFAWLCLSLRLYTWLTTARCSSPVRMTGRTVLVTGGNAGIGYETCLDLAGRGARVIIAGRNVERGTAAAAAIRHATGNAEVVFVRLNLADMASVREAAGKVAAAEPRLDVVVCNAGVALTRRYMTEAGLELHMATNHFGHFLLVNLLLPLLARTGAASPAGLPARAVVVSSLAHAWAGGPLDTDNLNGEKRYDTARVYAQTKLANVLFTRELARRCEVAGLAVTANCLHPGTVQTQLFRHLGPLLEPVVTFFTWLLYMTPREGAQTTVHLAVADEVAGVSGAYFANCRVARCSREAADPVKAAELWDRTSVIVDLQPEETHV